MAALPSQPYSQPGYLGDGPKPKAPPTSAELIRRPLGTSVRLHIAAAAAALFKAVVGTGIFALPPAIRACGMFLGSLLTVLMGLISLYTTWAMVEAVRELRRRIGVGAREE